LKDKKEKMKSKVIFTLAFVLAVMSICLAFASGAYLNLCLKYGEKVRYSLCNPDMTDSEVCQAVKGNCYNCVFIGSSGAYCPASPNRCNALGLPCTYLSSGGGGGGGGGVSSTKINITRISSPDNNAVYNARRVAFDMESNIPADWFYLNSDGTWKKICREEAVCNKEISFKDGENSVIIKAVNTNDESDFQEKSFTFFVDSKKPRIGKTYPKRGFASGTFTAEFSEANPTSLKLYYADKVTEMNESEIKSKCSLLDLGKYSCDIDVDISSYNNQDINFRFALTDIAGNSVESRETTVSVDTTPPMINSITHTFDGRYVYLSMDITEANIKEVRMFDPLVGYDKKLCSRLNDAGLCEKRLRFGLGSHTITIQATDKTGKSSGQDYSFVI